MAASVKSVALIICSTRNPRVCPQISTFVANTVSSRKQGSSAATARPPLTIIDLQDWKLPLFDEPGIPSQIRDPAQYAHEHTRAWSREVSRHDAFIFVTPQYNWGYPAALKNAIDYLFHEWKGKRAMIVSYGGHGGSECNVQLRQILEGLRMEVAPTPVMLTFPSMELLGKAANGVDVGLDAEAEDGIWNAERSTILAAYHEMLGGTDQQS